MIINGVHYDTDYPYYDNAKIHRDSQYNSFSDWMKRLDKCENQFDLEMTYSKFWAERYSFPLIYLEFANEWVTHLAYIILDKEMDKTIQAIRNYDR